MLHSLTSVGATTGVTETSASFSSGGFSAIFARPSYQDAAVSAYLTALGNTNSGRFSRNGRAFPDIAAQGDNVEIVVSNQFGLVGGTSCSSPIFASVIALLNDELAAAGKPPLGFINPLIYSSGGSALNDITTGSNPGCNTNGFPARAGWDPVGVLGMCDAGSLLTVVGAFRSPASVLLTLISSGRWLVFEGEDRRTLAREVALILYLYTICHERMNRNDC